MKTVANITGLAIVLSLVLLCWSFVPPANALTNADATIGWTPTTDSTIRMELRWKSFVTGTWQSMATNLDSTLGTYQFVFPTPFADSTGDRFLCIDARYAQGTNVSKWDSDGNTQACTQIPLAVVVPPTPVPTPVPVPTPPPPVVPPPSNLHITVLDIDTIQVAAVPGRCASMAISNLGLAPSVRCVH